MFIFIAGCCLLGGRRLKPRKRAIMEFAVLLLAAGLFGGAFDFQPVKSEEVTVVWTVDDSGPADFDSIQEAIIAAGAGDTIYVHNGTYSEQLHINKTLTLVGEDPRFTIINGSGLPIAGSLVEIAADNVSMSGFTVSNTPKGVIGIQIEDSRYCKIYDNTVCFIGNRGIAFNGGGFNEIHHNTVFNSTEFGSIESIYSDNNTIHSNIAFSNDWGIATNHGSYNNVFNNTLHSNNISIHIDWPSTGNTVHNNMIGPNFINGIAIRNQANRTTVSDNLIFESQVGLTLEGSPSNVISQNNIILNDAGISISESENNLIHHNNFVENTQQVEIAISYFNFWDYGYPYGGNFWGNYAGFDFYSGPFQNETGHDGIGDTPHVIDGNNIDYFPLMGARAQTPAGVNVTILPSDDLRLTFQNVTTEGYTNVYELETGPQPPEGRVAERYFEIESTADFVGPINLRFRYDDSNMTLLDEQNLQLILFTDPIPGDLDQDWDVDIFDIVTIARAYGSEAGGPRYTQKCDLDRDGDIDIFDVVIAASNYGQTTPPEERFANITTYIDTENNLIYGETPHISIFGVTRS